MAAAGEVESRAEGLERAGQAAREAGLALEACRAAVGAGRVEEGRREARRARELYLTEGVGEAGGKGLAAVEELERELEGLEAKLGLVGEARKVSFSFFSCLLWD